MDDSRGKNARPVVTQMVTGSVIIAYGSRCHLTATLSPHSIEKWAKAILSNELEQNPSVHFQKEMTDLRWYGPLPFETENSPWLEVLLFSFDVDDHDGRPTPTEMAKNIKAAALKHFNVDESRILIRVTFRTSAIV